MRLLCWLENYCFRITMFITFILTGMSELSAGTAEDAVKEKLEVYDQVFLSDYKLDLLSCEPTYVETSFGYTTFSLQISGDGIIHAQTKAAVTVEPIPFVDGLHPRSYDKAGDLVIGTPTVFSIYFDLQVGKIRTDSIVNTISRTRTLPSVSKPGHTVSQIYPPTNPDLLNLYFRYILPLGRGYSQLIDSVESVSQDPQGGLNVVARGKLFSDYGGRWKLHIDDNQDYLVRSATFLQDGFVSPQFSCQSYEPFAGELKLFSCGRIRFSDFEINVKLQDYRISSDKALIDSIIRESNDLASLSPRATVMDFHQLDSRGMPVIQRLKEVSSHK